MNDNKIEFSVDVNPPKATAQQKGARIAGKFIQFFKKKKVREAEALFTALCYQHAPSEPMEGALKLTIKWFFPYRKSEKKGIVREEKIIPHTVRPDLDNLEKSLIDTLTRLGFWHDDAQVCDKHTTKYWAPKGKISIKIESAE